MNFKTADIFAGRSVFLTGHTGFKGSWLVTLLTHLRASVHGFALAPESEPSLYRAASVNQLLASETIGDVRDPDAIRAAIRQIRPDIVVHMAAQAFVRRSYADPASTWSTNVMGTVNVLTAVRATSGIHGAIVVTTDKCYENRGWAWGYREIDRLGGHDPYSASKAGTELVVQSFRRSFFANSDTRIVSARAGNVIGGGDWSEDRLIPDAARAAYARTDLTIRNPHATRPWQHVLDCIDGYLTIAAKLLDPHSKLDDAYNFGPESSDNVNVEEVLTRMQAHWPEISWSASEVASTTTPHEASVLHLDITRARQQLGWHPKWTLNKALAHTAAWYREFQINPTAARSLMLAQIEEYLSEKAADR